MRISEAVDLLDAMALGAGRWDGWSAPDADTDEVVRAHRATAREAMAVLLAQDPDSADAVGVLDHLPTQPR